MSNRNPKNINGKRGRCFLWMCYDDAGLNIMTTCDEVTANDFGHALQKIAARIGPDSEIDKISIWESVPYEGTPGKPERTPDPRRPKD